MTIAEVLQLMMAFGSLTFTVTIGILTLVVSIISLLVQIYKEK